MALCDFVDGGENVDPPSALPPPSSTPTLGNPLLHQVVLQKVLEYLSFKDLAHFRLVSRYWYDASLSKWTDGSVISIKGRERNGANSNSRNELLSLLSIDNCLLAGPLHFAHFRVEKVVVDEDSRSFWTKLWEICGERMTCLEVINCPMLYSEFLAEMMYWKTPNLTTLWIENFLISSEQTKSRMQENLQEFLCLEKGLWGCGFEEHPHAPHQQGNLTTLELEVTKSGFGMPVKWDDLFLLYPNLEHLRIHFHHQDLPMLCEMLRAILKLREEDMVKLCLKTLDVIGTCDTVRIRYNDIVKTSADAREFANLLTKLKFPLETLCMDVQIHMDYDITAQILETHKKTLKKLDLYRKFVGEALDYPVTFPFGIQLPALKELRLAGHFFVGLEDFANIPNLQVLHLIQGVPGDDLQKVEPGFIRKTTDIDAMASANHFKVLKELRFDFTLTQEELMKLIEWMPNLETVKIPVVSDDYVQVMCEGWRKLAYLTVWTNTWDTEIRLPPSSISIKITEDLKRLKEVQAIGDPSVLMMKPNLSKQIFREYEKNRS